MVASAHRMPIVSNIFHCAVTSPPYYGLRAYKGDQVIEWPTVTYIPMVGLESIEVIGCDPACEHTWLYTPKKSPNASGGWQGGAPDGRRNKGQKVSSYEKREIPDETCELCGGWRGGLGAEPTIEMYIGHMILICREVKRTLRPDGVFWLNISDSYNGSGGAGGDYNLGGIREGEPKYPGRNLSDLKAGDLMMIPARLALALQANGWIVRKDNIWAKNAMPEPLKGWRWEHSACNCVKKQREAHITEQMKAQGIDRHRIYDKAGVKFSPLPDCPSCSGTGRKAEIGIRKGSWRFTSSHEYVFQLTRQMQNYADHTRVATSTGANPRDVMHPPRTNYSGKHFAVFPPHLIAPLLHASTPRMCCSECRTPWAPVIEGQNSLDTDRPQAKRAMEIFEQSSLTLAHLEAIRSVGFADAGKSKITMDGSGKNATDIQLLADEAKKVLGGYYREFTFSQSPTVTGYRPTCEHKDAPSIPGIVLDPFMGSGTTGMVAREFGVNFVGLDISYQYLDEQAKLRTQTGTPSKALDGLPLFNLEENDGKRNASRR